MTYGAAWGAVGIVVVAALACVPDPARKENGNGGGGTGGLIDVNTGDGGDAGASTSTVGGGGDPGASGGSTGSAGDTATGTGGDTTGAAGATGTAGSSAAGTSGTDAGGTGGTAIGGSGAGGSGGAAVGGSGGVAVGGSGGAAVGGSGGTAVGGAGGAPQPVNACDRTSWTFTPSVVCTTVCVGMADAQKLPANAIDGNVATRYTTGLLQGSKGPENVVLSFVAPVTISGISLYAKATTDAPNMYHVEYSTDGATFVDFAPPIAGAGTTTLLITFPAPTRMRAVRVTQTGKWPHWWSINEMTIVGCTTTH